MKRIGSGRPKSTRLHIEIDVRRRGGGGGGGGNYYHMVTIAALVRI